jgi:hypothetical protein
LKEIILKDFTTLLCMCVAPATTHEIYLSWIKAKITFMPYQVCMQCHCDFFECTLNIDPLMFFLFLGALGFIGVD